MERTRVNITVGLFVLLGVLALGYLSVKLGRVSFLGGGGYVVFAEFPSVGGLKPGSTVEIAGVEVGRVESIGLKNYEAIGPFFSSLGSLGGEFDADGYMIHFATALGPDSVMIPCGPDLNLEQHKRCDLLNEVWPGKP